ncbi:MAG: hypothetical protein U0746_02580 [Gemmataceae bacterium]
MHWLVGLDEAGYGPNLGPLVQAAVATRVPDEVDCLWDQYSAVFCRAGEAANGRLVIDDSKLIYSAANGLIALETGVLVALGYARDATIPLGELIDKLSSNWTQSCRNEVWFDPSEELPFATDLANLMVFGLRGEAEEQPCFPHVSCCVTQTSRFNDLIERHGSKAGPLAEGVISLLGAKLAALPTGEPVRFVIDKQGGRNFYAPMIQTAMPDGWVIAERETATESTYRVEGLGRDIRLIFKPRAERDCLPVALASMLAKYLREAFMRQFNRYWATHVPGIKPTAGYPGDAKRFYAEIRGAMEKLGLREDEVWRKR